MEEENAADEKNNLEKPRQKGKKEKHVRKEKK